MKKKTGSIIGILILIGVLGFVALFTGSVKSTLANDLLGREQAAPLPNTDHSEENAQLITSAPEIVDSGENIAQEVQDLSRLWHDANKKVGWIHIVSEYQVDQDGIREALDGVDLEDGYVQDQWFLLDEQGYEITHVSIQRDMNGNVIQVSALRDKTGYNLTLRVRFPMSDEAAAFIWNFGFPGMAVDFAGSLEKEMVSLEGQTVVIYTITEVFPSPMDFSEFNEPVAAIKTHACYEPESGKLLSLERVMIFSSGEERVTNVMELVSWERGLQPPTEVLAYLDATYEEDFIHPWEMTNQSEQEVTQ